MSFGLKKTESMYQWVMEKILDSHKKYAVAFIDNIAIHSSTFDKHLKHVDAELTAIGHVGITLHMENVSLLVQILYI